MNDQPMPKGGRVRIPPLAQERFLTVLQEQATKGRAKYGTDLHSHNGRDAFADAEQEAVDLWQYLQQARVERDADRAYIAELEARIAELEGVK